MASLRALLVVGALILPQQAAPQPSPRRVLPRIELQLDDKGADVAPWARQFILLLDREWRIPDEETTIVGHVGVTFNVGRDGKISDLMVIQPATADALNTAVHDAVEHTGLALQTPLTYPDDRMPVAAMLYYNEAPPLRRIMKSAPPAGVYAAVPAKDFTMPRLISEAKPQYTPDAMRAQIQGSVTLGCVVGVDGSVGEVRVLQSLDRWLGLDAQAVKSAREWKFAPGTHAGEAVPVWITIQLSFRLQ